MAVTPFKVFAGGEVLTASDLNSSFSQVFDNGEDLAWPATQARDFNGQELILDADGDTSITADTDDQIDFKLAGTDYVVIRSGATNDTVTITNDSLTTGDAVNVVSNSSDATARNLVFVHNDHASATGARCLVAQQDSNGAALVIDMNGNGQCIDIDTDQTSAIVMRVDADSLTTGNIISLSSGSADASFRNLVIVENTNASATSAVCMRLNQSADSTALFLDQNGDGRAILAICDNTTAAAVDIAADSLTSGKILDLTSNSSDGTTRELVTIHNNHVSANGTTCLELIQDASFRAVLITANGTAAAVDINCDGPAFDIDAVASSSAAAVFDITAAHSSYGGDVLSANSHRIASNAFNFLAGYSDSDGTPDKEVELDGSGDCFCDGSFTGGGADYAEYFEWADGNPTNEDRRGIAVELVGDKIRPATDPSTAIGVISGNPSMVGDAAWNKWAGKYLRDDYGSYIMEDYEVWSWHDEDGKRVNYVSDRIPEDVAVPGEKEVVVQQRRKLNPSFDLSIEYVNRADRPEWGCVGLVGKLRVKKGQITGAHWFKMRDVSASVEEWLVR